MALTSDHDFAPSAIATAVFPMAFRGYDQDAVRTYLSRLSIALEQRQVDGELGPLFDVDSAQGRVAALEEEAEALRAEIRELELELVQRSVVGESPGADDTVDGFDETRAIELLGQETARVLESARSAAADILKRAEAQATGLRKQAKTELNDAHAQAETLVSQRQAESEELARQQAADAEVAAERIKVEAEEQRALAREESRRMITEAEASVADIAGDAEERARQIVADAETLRQQVIAELVTERRSAQVEIDQLASARDRLSMSLAVARSELDELAVELAGVVVPTRRSSLGDAVGHGSGPVTSTEIADIIADLEDEPTPGEPIDDAEVEVDDVEEITPVASITEPSAPDDIEFAGEPSDDPELGLQLDVSEQDYPVEPTGDLDGFATLELDDGEHDHDFGRGAEADTIDLTLDDGGSDPAPAEIGGGEPIEASPSPAEVITTVASRTATFQPDRTRGDLMTEEPFTGRLPKEFAARDMTLTRCGANFRRHLRRALNDDQSDVLDRLRAGRGEITTDELPEFGDQIDRYLAPLRRGLAEVAQAGAKADKHHELSPSALDNLVRQLAKFIVDKVRVPTVEVIELNTDHDRELILEPIRSLYRDFRNVALPDLAEDALYEAYAIGLYDSIDAAASVRWAVDPRSDPDPICEINRDRPAAPKGEVFPSGHVRPLSLPGCRCLVVQT